ncbi:MAG: putative ABC transporter permease [Ruthenibacterium sp.]
METFTFYTIAWYFCIYALLGWCLEVCFCTVDTGKFVNRGFLNGPVCPIYGFGMVIILLILTPLSNHLLLLYVGAVLLTSALELVTGFILKKVFHTSWWDYSDAPFNLGGYICLKFSLAWGIGGVFAIRGIHPLIARFVAFIPKTVGWIVLSFLFLLFFCDAVVTITEIAKLNKDLGRIDEIVQKLHDGSDVLAKNLGDGALVVDEKFDDAKKEVNIYLDLLKTEWRERKHLVHKRLLKAFPAAKNTRYTTALEALKVWYNKK